MLRKIIAGGETHQSRFHDENGKFIGVGELLYIPYNLPYIFLSKVLGRRAEQPWWPFTARNAIEAILHSDSVVIEFGSGYSTLWLARRASHVFAIEDNPEWFRKIESQLRERNISNITLLNRKGEEFYDLSEFPPSTFDLAVVDGYCRFGCVRNVIPKLKAGGYLYLDNSDADKDSKLNGPGEKKKAQSIIIQYLEDHQDSFLQRFSGLVIGELSSAEGMLMKLPK
ncbi:MAG: class I SAM-dependent methyltransferase [Thermodesulfobacteriota bacterium]